MDPRGFAAWLEHGLAHVDAASMTRAPTTGDRMRIRTVRRPAYAKQHQGSVTSFSPDMHVVVDGA